MIPFTKAHGIGNDFVIVDQIRDSLPGVDWPALASIVCDRRKGIGADGLLLMTRGIEHPLRMIMFNPDGSEGEMCGNGIRCIARMANERGHVDQPAMRCETKAGIKDLQVLSDCRVRVGMGQVSFSARETGITDSTLDEWIEKSLAIGSNSVAGTVVSVGNPHFVTFVEDVSQVPLTEWGSAIERHPLFRDRINAHFAQVVSRSEILQRTWERGAGATQACGTGACACVAAGVRTGRLDRRVVVRLPGGNLEIENDEAGHLWMTGPAEIVYEGEFLLMPPIS